MELQKSIRYRVNISISVKGVKTWDCTVELDQSADPMPFDGAIKSMEDTLELSDKLVAALESRYPIMEVK